MRHAIIALLLGCALASVGAIQRQQAAAVEKQAAGSCASSDTSLSHGVLLEGFTSPLENTWTEVDVPGNLTVGADTSALSTGKPTGACDTGMFIDLTATAGTEVHLTRDYGSTIDVDATPLTLIFHINVTDNFDTNAENILIFCATLAGTISATSGVSLTLNNASGTLQVRARGSSNSSYQNLSAGWNELRINVGTATTGSASSLQVNGGTPATFDRGANDIRYFTIGAPQLVEAGDDVAFYIDLAAFN